MNKTVTHYRSKIIHGIYSYLLKPIFFLSDPELIHDRMTDFGKFLGHYHFGQKITSGLFNYKDDSLRQEILGMTFENPVGLSAGFDKNAELVDILPSVGFGFVEVGSVTGDKCSGNPKPRLWRLPKSQSLMVYYGLKNDGCEAIADRIKDKKPSIPVGVSVAMTNCQKNLLIENAVEDFAKSFKVMESVANYITINISCPNLEGGQPFISPSNLDRLFNVLDGIPTKKAVFVKLSPDLNQIDLDSILSVIYKHRIHGIICTNLTKSRDNSRVFDKNIPNVGGMSGKVVQDMSDKMLAYIYKKMSKKLVLVGSGGVFSAEDAYKKIRLGASLVQMITGMIFEGPQVIGEINQSLAELLKRDGFKNIREAVGVDNLQNL
ncbi:MAG: quinone-dependent dihydroorotate dehydrogenase [Parcubacteria group bacterium]|nr:quinone-dependent dihydroorotate dehydrogenase [Parcubacteria group bacterium]